MTATIRKKLIEVSIPLEAINVASAREKAIRHGHPSTLHLWWARRPLAACRAVLFAQLVDDPSAWPERFPTEAEQDVERRRLHKVIERMVPWEASNDEAILNEARWEIARSVAWGLGEEPPAKGDGEAILDYLQTKAPPVYDPFSGGGSIPLEAQRLGLRAYGSDLNPVAVLIGKALVEIPPKFAGLPPVNPKAQAELKRGGKWNGKGAQGLAEDVRYYGQWMRDEAEKRIGHLYPKARLPDGSEATVIAWLWARTVRSPDPAAKGAMVPLVSSYMLSTKEGKKAWVEPVTDRNAQDGWRFEVSMGPLQKEAEERLKRGNKTGRGSNFTCVLTGAAIDGDHVRAEGVEGRLGARLMAVVVEGARRRVYLSPSREQEKAATIAAPSWQPEGDLPHDPRNFWTVQYGLSTFSSLFAPRQLVALTTLSDLVKAACGKALTDASAAGLQINQKPIYAGGVGADAYSTAIATYLAFMVSQVANHSATICGWNSANAQMRSVFARQAIPMTWDYAEVNIFSESSGSYYSLFDRMIKGFAGLPIACGDNNAISANDAADVENFPDSSVIITDPPYFDNITYADLSDFFYIWLRHTLLINWPELFRRLVTPKSRELIAAPYRHGGAAEAEAFFMRGMGQALSAMRCSATELVPLVVFYAFKQSEVSQDGVTSAGWSSFLQAVVNAGLVVDGTWPIDTEKKGRSIEIGANALASSVVLVCRKRSATASIVTRAEFIRSLKREMPDAIDNIRKAGVGPVDMQQSVIGPGMGVFTRYAKVLESDDSPMIVRTALTLINRVWEEIENELDGAFDPETQVALAWFGSYGYDTKKSGELNVVANAKNVPEKALFDAHVFKNLHGNTALTPRAELPLNWRPSTDKHITVWRCVQQVARMLKAEEGGGEAAAKLVAEMGSRAADAQKLAYRLFEIATRKGLNDEALVYNELAQEWAKLEDLAASAPLAASAETQAAFQFQ